MFYMIFCFLLFKIELILKGETCQHKNNLHKHQSFKPVKPYQTCNIICCYAPFIKTDLKGSILSKEISIIFEAFMKKITVRSFRFYKRFFRLLIHLETKNLNFWPKLLLVFYTTPCVGNIKICQIW